MSINQVAASIPGIPRAESAKNGSVVGKDDFLKLLVTQLQRQDPLNPQDPTEFTAQLTQFSSLEQLLSVNDQLKQLGAINTLGLRAGAAGYIGREASILGDRLVVAEGKPSAVQFELAGNAEAVAINVYDADGKLVDIAKLGAREAGRHNFAWSGLLASGGAAPDGDYSFEVVATDADGNGIPFQTQFSGTIDSLSFERGRTMVRIGGSSWPIEDVLTLSASN